MLNKQEPNLSNIFNLVINATKWATTVKTIFYIYIDDMMLIRYLVSWENNRVGLSISTPVAWVEKNLVSIVHTLIPCS